MPFQVGDIVQRVDIHDRKRFVVVRIEPPWIYTRRIGGGGTPGIITFPSQFMLKKVA